MKEFKINEYLIVKLENDTTNIYVNGEYFRQCKYLYLNIPVHKITDFEDIESIDEAAERLDSSSIEQIEGLDECRSLKSLYLRNNDILEIKGLENLVQLEHLDLYNNQIVDITGLKNLKSLKYLDLSGNYLRKLTVLKDLQQLSTLKLDSNFIRPEQLEGVDKNGVIFNRELFISSLNELENTKLNKIQDLVPRIKKIFQKNILFEPSNFFRGFILEKNDIETIEELESILGREFSLHHIKSVNNFYTHDNLVIGFENHKIVLVKISLDSQIRTLPKCIANFSSLKKLYISLGSNLSEIPETIYQLFNLKILEIHHSSIKHLSESIGNLVNLELLSLDYNELTFLPLSIGKLRNLIALYLCGNKITYLPIQIGNLSSLLTMTLEDNRIIELPESMVCLQSLSYLRIKSNFIIEFPKSFGKFDWEVEDIDDQPKNFPGKFENIKTRIDIDYGEDDIEYAKKRCKSCKRVKKSMYYSKELKEWSCSKCRKKYKFKIDDR